MAQLTGDAVQGQQAGRAALRQGIAGDQLVRQVKMKIGDIHGLK